MFCTFNQNNSGGHFDYDAERGITHYVIVEAETFDKAIERAKDIGLYFDGKDDCPCCVNRWSDYPEDGTESPMVYGENPDEDVDIFRDRFNGNSTCIHRIGKPFEFVQSKARS